MYGCVGPWHCVSCFYTNHQMAIWLAICMIWWLVWNHKTMSWPYTSNQCFTLYMTPEFSIHPLYNLVNSIRDWFMRLQSDETALMYKMSNIRILWTETIFLNLHTLKCTHNVRSNWMICVSTSRAVYLSNKYIFSNTYLDAAKVLW